MDIQIISGFLGAGKTTFINRYLPFLSGKTCVIENEFGDISLDGNLIAGETEVREITSGCICCTLSGDFRQALTDLKASAEPDHILIEPTGIGRLSDILDDERDGRSSHSSRRMGTTDARILDDDHGE